MAPIQDVEDLCTLPLQVGSTFRRDGSMSFQVVAIDADDQLVTCKLVDEEEWRIFYNFGGRHPLYENIRMNDVDMIIHPPNQHLGSLGFATHFNIVDEVAFGSPAQPPQQTLGQSLLQIADQIYDDDEVAFGSPAQPPQQTLGQSLLQIADQIYDDDEIVDAIIEQPFLYNFYGYADNVPNLDETAFLRVGYRFYITADGIIPYTITAIDGDPVHTIECCDLQDRSCSFRLKSYGKEDAEPLQLRDMVELIE